jgi:hypothetical protein
MRSSRRLGLLTGAAVLTTMLALVGGAFLVPTAAPHRDSGVIAFAAWPTLVAAVGAPNGGSSNISATIHVKAGDLIVAFVSGLAAPLATSVVSDTLADHFVMNTTKTDGTWTTNLSVAIAASTANDTVHFHSTSGNLLMVVWDVHGSVGYIENTSAMTVFSTGNKATTLSLDHANALVGIVGITDQSTADGLSTSTDPSLTYDSAASINTNSFGEDVLWMSPSNGTGSTPVDVAHNHTSGNRLSGMSFYIDPAAPVVGGGGGTLGTGPNTVGFLFLALVASAMVFTLFLATRDRRR